MIRINRQTDYAVRVILALTRQVPAVRIPSAAVQREMQIPPGLMPRIVARLAKAQLLKTFPGREGGLMLARPAATISMRDVVEALEGPILLSQCLRVRGEDDCPFQMNCPVRSKWDRVQVIMLREMASISFEDLAHEAVGVSMSLENVVS